MKIAWLTVVFTGVALIHGTGYAELSRPASQEQSSESTANTVSDHPRDTEQHAPADGRRHQRGGKASDQQRDLRRADENHPPSRASLTKGNRPKQLSNSRQRSLPGNAINLHQPGSGKSDGAAKGGFIQTETVHNALPVRPPSVVRPTVPSLNSVRHRGTNPAVVGGWANLHTRNAGAINGTRMNRKP